VETNPKNFAPAENLVFNRHFTAATTPAPSCLSQKCFYRRRFEFFVPFVVGMPTVTCNFLMFGNLGRITPMVQGFLDWWLLDCPRP
jgi:hypothetical protein